MRVSLSRKEHKLIKTIVGEQEHGSNANSYCQECSKGKRPSGLFVGEGKKPTVLFGGIGKRPNALFDGEDTRSNTLFVNKGKRPNA